MAEAREAELADLNARAGETPLVQAILTAFPGAKITEVRLATALVDAAAVTALPEVEADDDWDPFEE